MQGKKIQLLALYISEHKIMFFPFSQDELCGKITPTVKLTRVGG